jgi:TonB family protein
MPPAPTNRARGHLGRGVVLSVLAHGALLAPVVVAAIVLGGREEAQRAEEVDVGFESVADEQLPADLPPLEPPKSEEPRDKLKPDAKKPPKKKLAPAIAKVEPVKPEPEIVTPPMPPMPPEPKAPPPPPHDQDHRKSVEVENDKNEPPPPNANYLAEKNHAATEETRATRTNLEKESKGEDQSESAPSNRTDEQVGGPKEQIRQLADETSAAGKRAPAVTPHVNPELSSDDERREQSLLALRNPTPRSHEVTPETADPSLPHAADGELREQRPTARGADSHADKANGKKVKLAITGRDYEYMFGADAEAERRLAKKLKSTSVGRFRERQARVKSSLENFIPEVKPGNQTELSTRAAPFAVFIARMHRSIHALWGFQQLEDWDELGSSSPLNNPNLLTTLELVLNADGTVDKVTIVRASGYLPYDTAAIDVAFSAGPYPEPPHQIRSANGKIYVHWNFHRDGRQCSPAYVDYYILNNPPTDADKASLAKAEAAVAEGTPAPEEGPKHLRRGHDDAAHSEKMRALDEEVARAEAREGVPHEEAEGEPAPAAPAQPVAEAREPEARAVGARWFAALAAGDVTAMAALAEVPFRTTGGGTVKTRAELQTMLKDLATELGRKGLGGVQVLSGAGVRAALGRLPPGLDDGSGLLFAVSTLREGDALIAGLAKRGNTYRVVALVRR